MSAFGSSSLVRSAAVLTVVAIIGAVGGYVWERSTATDDLAEFQEQAGGDEGAVAPRTAKHSELEKSTVRRATLGLPQYKGAVPQALGADYLGPGTPIAVAWFMTRDSPQEVLDFYELQFRSKGLNVVGKKYSPSAGYVGYMDPKTDEVHIVSVIAQGGETAVFPSSGQMDNFAESATRVPDRLPHPAGAVGTTVLQFRIEGAIQFSVAGTVPEGTVGDVADFYKKGFAEKGWTVQKVTRPNDFEARVEAKQGRSMATAFIRQTLVSKGVKVYLTVTDRS